MKPKPLEWIPELSLAEFSPCHNYRYTLHRAWVQNPERRTAFIGLNPSTADLLHDDSTVKLCVRYAKRWGFDGMVMLNAFAWRDTNPAVMKAQPEPQGIDNRHHIASVLTSGIEQVVLCWGNHAKHLGQHERMLSTVKRCVELNPELKVVHLGPLTRGGYPRHPLMLSKNVERIPWEFKYWP